jgi:hypothetical protein|tara:strand:- start:440 stop:949 length:510 start_codon:yes stop_codon:yes gene_type:complete
MGWFGRLGNAIVGGVQKLGHAAHQGIDSAVRLVDKVAPKVEAIASKVAMGAGIVGKVASAALPFTAEIPIVGEVVGGIAAGARVVQGVAKGVKRGAQFAEMASDKVKQIERGMMKDASRAQKIGKDFIANPNLHDAKRYRNELSSMVRHNADNVRDARNQFSRIRGGKP